MPYMYSIHYTGYMYKLLGIRYTKRLKNVPTRVYSYTITNVIVYS